MLAGSCLQCLRGVAFLEGTYSVLERCLQCFGGAWHFEEALVLEGRGILEEALAVVLEGCGIFGGAWHF